MPTFAKHHQSQATKAASATAKPAAKLIASEIYRTSRYGSRHPLAIPRVSLVVDLCSALGWLPTAEQDPNEEVYIDSPMATPAQLARFHDPDYIAAVQRAEAEQGLPDDLRQRYNIGINGNPIFPEVFSRPATACGAALKAVELLRDGGVVHSLAGGTHHGMPDRANGFCYFNDPVLSLLGFLDQGFSRLFYLDLDAHHGDGVQLAFAEEPRVFTLSLHEYGRWPMKPGGLGDLDDRCGGTACNLPVPEGFNDSEMAFLLEAVILPKIAEFEPEVLIVQGGCDGLADDPLSRLKLSNLALWNAVASVKSMAPRVLLLGGGGYNPYALARCWTGYWAILKGFEIPDRINEEAEEVLRSVAWRHRLAKNPPERWFTTLADPPAYGPIRQDLRELAKLAIA